MALFDKITRRIYVIYTRSNIHALKRYLYYICLQWQCYRVHTSLCYEVHKLAKIHISIHNAINARLKLFYESPPS